MNVCVTTYSFSCIQFYIFDKIVEVIFNVKNWMLNTYLIPAIIIFIKPTNPIQTEVQQIGFGYQFIRFGLG